ncbi:cell wall protein DAN4-like [Xiphophorus maculatus]|uniref:cell wall protein DAN4-like n=1 Tax=Xiphophorus maculatus TaxID=8083 RepID=UPI000C6EF34B|nr:cell wall protein DAN4-like [Xiphophorus maculatus]
MDLEKKVIETYDSIYKKKFGILFVRSFVIAFRNSTQSAQRLTTTEAEVGLEFNKTTTSDNLPKNEVVQETLREAINSTTFNVTFIPNTINLISTPLATPAPTTNATDTTNTTTTAPTTNATTTNTTTTPTTNATTTNTTTTAPITNATTTNTTTTPTTNTTTTTTPTTNTTTPTTTTTTNTTNATTTPTTNTTTTTTPTTTTTTVESLVKRRLTFRSAGEIFTTELLDTSSTAFIKRAVLLKTHLEPLYQAAFASYRSFIVISFSNGSIINNIDLGFATASQPSSTQITDILVKANSTVTAFNIDINSIFVDGTQTSSGASHKISLITAFSMVLLSWLLSTQQ